MKAFTIRHKVPLIILSFVTAAIALGFAILLIRQQTTNNIGKVEAVPSFADSLSTHNLDVLGSTLSENVQLTQVGSSCCNLDTNKELVIALLLQTLATNDGGFSRVDVKLVDISNLTLPTDFSTYEVLLYADGKSWIAYKVNDQGKVTDLIINFSDEKLPTENLSSSSSSSATSVSTSSFQGTLTTKFMDNGTKQISKLIESDDAGVIIFITESNLLGANCSAKYYNTGVAPEVLVEEKEFQVLSNQSGNSVDLKIGKFEIRTACNYQGQQFKDVLQLNVQKAPASICDTKVFDFTTATKTFTEVKDGIVGKWRGCTKNPWTKPYEVEFTFNTDGTYSSKNIEIAANSSTLRTNTALYYGSDADDPNKKFELRNQLSNGDVEGDIYVYFGSASTVLDKIKLMRLNQDNSKLYLEVIHLGSYGPLRYELEKINDGID